MSYEPTHPGESITPAWLYDELLRIASEMSKAGVTQFEISTREPERPQDGMLVYADGTSWNPGAGAGLYERRSGAWVKL